MTWPFRRPKAGQTLWEARTVPQGFVPDERDIAGFRVRLKRRKPTFLEEVAITANARNNQGGLHPLIVLAQVVELTCRDIEHGVLDESGKVNEWQPLDLGPERVGALEHDAELAFAFVEWLAADTIRNATGQTKEALKKKRGQ